MTPLAETGSLALSLQFPQSSLSSVAVAPQYKAISDRCAEFGISEVEARVYDEDNVLLAWGGPWSCDAGQGSLTRVKRGSNRAVRVNLNNDEGRIILTGKKSNITVIAGKVVEVVIEIDLLSSEEVLLDALNDSATVNRGGTVTVLDSGYASLLHNDLAPDMLSLSANTAPISGPNHGSLTLYADGTFSYTHDGGNDTTDSFTYEAKDAHGGSDIARVTITISSNESNHAPVLSNALVSPETGGTDTNFTFDIRYTDQDGHAPSARYVYIDGTPHLMVLSAGQTAWDGSYTYSTKLSAGSHKYYYSFSDGHGGSARLPASGSFLTLTIPGPGPGPGNHDPVLDKVSISPGNGSTLDTFTYTIHYYDQDNDTPVTSSVYIDGTQYKMDLSSGSGSNGTYTYSTPLAAGSDHTYYFSFEDGKGGFAQQPAQGLIKGPAVSVPSPCAANFTATPNKGNAPLAVTFADTSAGSPTSWLWSFGDGTTSSAQNPPIHTYSVAGTYTITLTASGPCGSNKRAYTVKVCNAITADFTATPHSGNAPLAVTFADTSTGTVTSWSWNFGDGTTSSAQNPPVHTYSVAGTYTVTLTASGTCESKTRTYPVRVCNAITADFTATPNKGYAPLAVTFADTSTGTVTSWLWNFGDGTTSSAQNPPVHTYSAAGTYTVTLTATGPCGSNTRPYSVTVCNPITANFTATPNKGYVPLAVTFADTSTGSPTSWLWNFGDGTTSSAQNPPVHTYSAAGTYTVTLTATGPCGSNTRPYSVTVCNPITANFTATPTSGPAPLTVTFADTSIGSPTSWLWDFGDGATSTAMNPSHQYTTAGTYTVILTATNSCGSNSLTRTNYITVASPDKVYVSPGGSSGNTGIDWAHTVPTIQEAINLVAPGGQIWIRQGTYLLTSEINVNKSVSLYGGFNGTESLWGERNWSVNVTTVDGQNTLRCFLISGASSMVIIDGLCIHNGSSPSGPGGAVYNSMPISLDIANCTFRNNQASRGGGIYNSNSASNLKVLNCLFEHNTASTSLSGGGIYSMSADTEISRSVFTGNTAGNGGGVACTGPKICISNSLFNGNSAYTGSYDSRGGGIGIWNSADAAITNCTVYGNQASYKGGGIYCESSTASIWNSIVWGNSWGYYNKQIYALSSTVTLYYSDVELGSGESPWGAHCINENPGFIDPANGNFHLSGVSPCIDKGLNEAPCILDTDLEGSPRIIENVVDMGAYEFGY